MTKRNRNTKRQTKEIRQLLNELGISVNSYYNYKYGRTEIPERLLPYLQQLKLQSQK